MGIEFAHLHVHTEYSLLDGFSRIDKLANEAKQLGMNHLAITDHGAMYGVLEFYKQCKKTGINPIIGVEAYFTDDIFNKTKRFKDDYKHLLLLAENDQGYRNLMKLTTVAHTEGMHSGKPRIDKKLLEQYGEGVIATSSCLGGEIPQKILAHRTEEAYEAARWYRNVLGPKNFFLEIQAHGGSSEQKIVNEALYQMHRDLEIPLLATNDLHYIAEGDANAHDILLCVQTRSQITDQKRFKFDCNEYFLRSPEQMLALFPELEDALLNTVRLAERCVVDPYARKASLPTVPIPDGFANDEEYFRHLCYDGVRRLYGEISDGVRERMEYELSVIMQKGFVPYFLVVGDYVSWARQNGIRCLARGSAAGSLVAYSLGITNVDPLRYTLLFERFLNPERDDMPDIDMDFPDDRREEVINYISQKYGHERVAQMATFMTMAAKNSVKDVARAMGRQDLGDRIARLIPTGPKITLAGSLSSERDLARLYQEDHAAKELLDIAKQLEGTVRGTGVHAAGVVVTGEPLVNYIPLQQREGRFATQIEQKHLEELGIIKFDILGLANLSLFPLACEFIKQNHGVDIDIETLPLDPTGDEEEDKKHAKAFDLLMNGHTIAVFQLESPKMREYIKQLKPTCVEDITAMVALYRPGPMDSIPDFVDAKHGRKKITYLDPRLEEWLKESYGVIVYQDQVLQIAVNLAGFSWGKVNKFRKALSKKIMHEVEGYKGDFVKGCIANGVKKDVAEELFVQIMPFGGYGFNKAHAASYAVVAYYTAYLKANYPAEYLAAALACLAADQTKIALLLTECRRMGVSVLGPDVNKSTQSFTVEGGAVRFGLIATKGVGEGPIEAILSARKSGGPFASLADFCTRVDPKAVGKSVIETLIKVGAMDIFADGQRHILLESVDRAIAFGKNERAAKDRGMLSLFDDLDDGSDSSLAFQLSMNAKEIDKQRLLEYEKELLGFYLSKHPLAYLDRLLEGKRTHTSADLSEEADKQKIKVAGIVRDIRKIITKKQDEMATFTIEDEVGPITVTAFPQVYEEYKRLLDMDAVLIVEGETQMRGEDIGVICRKISQIEKDQIIEQTNKKRYTVYLHYRTSGSDDRAVSDDILKLQELFRLINSHPGDDQYELVLELPDAQCRLVPSKPSTLAYSNIFQEQVEGIFSQKGHIITQEIKV